MYWNVLVTNVSIIVFVNKIQEWHYNIHLVNLKLQEIYNRNILYFHKNYRGIMFVCLKNGKIIIQDVSNNLLLEVQYKFDSVN